MQFALPLPVSQSVSVYLYLAHDLINQKQFNILIKVIFEEVFGGTEL